MRNDNEGGKEIAVCEDQDCSCGDYGSLTEQQNSSEEIGDEYYGQNEWDEAINSWQVCRKWRHNGTGQKLKYNDCERRPTLPQCW